MDANGCWIDFAVRPESFRMRFMASCHKRRTRFLALNWTSGTARCAAVAMMAMQEGNAGMPMEVTGEKTHGILRNYSVIGS